MQKPLFLSLSAIALVGLSTISYATNGDWIWYSKDYTVSRPEGRIPNGDCLEMMCEHGCVENSQGIGECCPGNKKCRVSGQDISACCNTDEICNKGHCVNVAVRTCTFNWATYDNGASVGQCGKCQNGSVVQDTTKTSDCHACNTSTWNWDNLTDYTNKDTVGKCCINGIRTYDTTNCPNPATQCALNGTTYNNGASVGQCGKCQNGSVVQDTTKTSDCHTCNTSTWNWDNLTDYTNNKDAFGQCCINGVRAYDAINCPEPCPSSLPTEGQTCTVSCGCDSDLICDSSTLKCKCPANKFWDGTACIDMVLGPTVDYEHEYHKSCGCAQGNNTPAGYMVDNSKYKGKKLYFSGTITGDGDIHPQINGVNVSTGNLNMVEVGTVKSQGLVWIGCFVRGSKGGKCSIQGRFYIGQEEIKEGKSYFHSIK